ncbi:MAG: hypothetical protein EOP06_05645, partial [Proteobacteria bacterium]
MKMRHLFPVALLTTSLVSSSFAQEAPQPVLVEIPVEGSKTALSLGIGAPDVSDAEAEAFFEKLRAEMQASAAHSPHVSFKRFTKESATMLIALTAVNFEAMLVDNSENPNGLQDILMSITDPIGHLSFYMFMVANGYTSDILSKRITTQDPLAKAQALRRISYLGMSAGSIASSLSGEILGTLKECGRGIFTNKADKEKVAQNMAICDSALKQWTLGNKVQSYIPLIVSLLASQEISVYAEQSAKRVIVRSRAEMMAVLKKTKSLFQANAVEVAITATPTGASVRGLRVLGKIAQFAGFTFIDHKINPFIHKGSANVTQPIAFSMVANDFNRAAFNAKKTRWYDDSANAKLAEALVDVKESMSKWRQSQLSEFYVSHSIWSENLKNIIDQTMTTYGFY